MRYLTLRALHPNSLEVETVHLKLPRLPRAFSGFRIAHISDIHMGGWMNRARLQRVVDVITVQKPDVVLITGDFLFGRRFPDIARQWLDDMAKVLSPLAASIPSFAVLGNHDYWTNPQAVRETLRRCRITDLTNAVHTLTRDGEKLYLCGVDDIKVGDVRLDEVVAQLEDHSAAILLVHEPDFADISAATGKFDLQVSGHSHGGQIVIPFYGPPVLPRTGRKYPSGLYKVGNMYQYTTRGVGMDRFAIRFNCPAEISILNLESMNSEAA
jgi:predicted MPP superfamily phosphohydrolase